MRWLDVARKVVCAAGLCALPLLAQSAWQPEHRGIGFTAASGKQSVELVSPSELETSSARPQGQQLRFAINTGLHINSHVPKSSFLIPTRLTLDAPSSVQIASIEYPPGVDYHFAFAPQDALSVYTGEFAVKVQLKAKPGHYVLHGQLHYQACDNRACNPPKTLPITLNLTAR